MDNRIKSLYITNVYQNSDLLKPLANVPISNHNSSLAYLKDFSTFSQNKETTITDPFLLFSVKRNQKINNPTSVNKTKNQEYLKTNPANITLSSLQVKQSYPVAKASTSVVGYKIAVSAKTVAGKMNTSGECYTGVATALEKSTGTTLYGKSAYMAADQLAKNSKFKQVKVDSNELTKLPPGAVVVWGKTAKSPNGHISVALGNGLEASDHIQKQIQALRGYTNYKVFLPIAAELLA
jgi:hypothetical protein